MMKNITIAKQTPHIASVNADANFSVGRRTGSLAGKFLVAAPSMQDTGFARAVIYLCQHSEAGAMGLIVNYPVHNLKLEDILEQMNMKNDAQRNVPVHFGGPIDGNRGFIIHSDEFTARGTIVHHDGLAVTSNAEVLEAIIGGDGPKQGMLVIGYAGWSAGQLEAEMESGCWIVASASKQLLFDTSNDRKWGMAIASLGFDVGNFSSVVGHA